MEKLYLCYVKDRNLFFTNKKAKDVWGDDWDDAPLEHNADEPYLDMVDSYAIVDVGDSLECNYFQGYEDIMNANGIINSDYSVEDLNKKGAFPWFRLMFIGHGNKKDLIIDEFYADIELKEVLRALHVYNILYTVNENIKGKKRKYCNFEVKEQLL